MYNILNKGNLLARTRQGDLIAEYIYRQKGLEFSINKSIKNPFYKDTKPSVRFSIQNNILVYNDFGNQNYKGNIFDFAKLFWNENNFYNLLKKINQDLRLNLTEKQRPELPVQERRFSNSDISCWKQYGIDYEQLNKYGVISVQSYQSRNRTFLTPENKNVFAYNTNKNCFKIYRPKELKYKFFWIGEKPKNFIFGFEQLDDTGEVLFITGGEKDVITLNSHNYNAISLNSETTNNIDNEILTELKGRFSFIFVLFDNDATGLKSSKLLSEKYGFEEINLKPIPNDKAKDISDYFAYFYKNKDNTYFTKEIFQDIINEKLKPLKINKYRFPDSVYQELPEFFTSLLEPFKEQQQRDIILMSSLVVMSDIFNNVYGLYDKQKIYPNFYTFIIGEASSGKGIISSVKYLGNQIHDELIKTSREKFQEFKSKSEKEKREELMKWELLYLPANSTSAGIYELIYNNGGHGIIFETEGDTLTNSFNNEMSNFSDLLRKAFHHETVSSFRKTTKEYFNVEEPKLSCLLTGTPNQVTALIPNTENGTFSRFVYYILESNPIIRDVFSEEKDLSEHFKKFGEELFLLYFISRESTKEWKFKLTKDQENLFLNFLKEQNENLIFNFGEQLSQSVKRLGVVLYRIMMILTASADNYKSEELICRDEHFKITLEIGIVLIEHLKKMSRVIPLHDLKLTSNYEITLYQKLPPEFKRSEAVMIANTNKISASTLDRLLKKENLIEKVKQGEYRKKIAK